MSLPRPARRLQSASLVFLALLAPTSLLAAGVSATGPLAETQLEPGGQPAAPLASALDSVRADNIRADIFFIASDELEGRYTPSPGLRIAARYIRSRLQRLGLEPGAPDGYFYRYPLTRQVVDEEASHVTFEAGGETHTLEPGRDFYYRYPSFWADMSFSGPVVFCGKGSDEELEKAELEDAWALILDGGEDAWRASRGARRAGALGSILVPTADYQGESYAERLGPSLEKAREGSYSFPRKDEGDDEDGGRRRRMRLHPQLYMTREAGLRLLAAAPGHPEGEEGWLPAVGKKLDVKVTDERRLADEDAQLMVEDVCGFWPGSDPVLSKEVLIVSAHYDHVGIQGGEICNGADDNGSGTTGLMAVAEALAHYGPMRRSVMLIWVSGEERGLWGSRAWSESPWLPEGCKPVANLNIDMIGRNAPDELMITPTKGHDQYNFIVDVAQRMAPLEGFKELASADDFYHRSDQAMFASLGIPVAFLFSGLHEDYHKPSDDPEKIDCDKIRRVVRLVVRLLDALQGDTLEIAAADTGK
jgi:hypothetical protein